MSRLANQKIEPDAMCAASANYRVLHRNIELNIHYGSQLGRVFTSIKIGAFRSCVVFQSDYNSTKPI
jgi:hypothetical protein